MDYPEGRYYKLNIILLSLIGQNPYQSMVFTVVIAIVYFSVTISGALSQIAKLVKERFAIQFVIDIVPAVVVTLMCIIYAPVSYTNINKNKSLLGSIKNDWHRKRPEEEAAIKHKFAERGQFLTFYFTVYVCTAAVVIGSSVFYPQFLDLVIPLNESRQRIHPFEFEIFIDKQKYFYILLAYEYAVVAALMLLVVGNETLGLICALHACGMFAVIGHRLEKLASLRRAALKNEVNYKRAVITNVKHCLAEHREALDFVDLLSQICRVAALITLTASTITLGVLLTAIMNPQLLTGKTIPFTIGQTIQLFLMCYMGQFVSNASEKVAHQSYNTVWYDFPIAAQKLILLMVLRSSKPCETSINEFGVLSLKNFSVVIQTSMSYSIVFKEFL